MKKCSFIFTAILLFSLTAGAKIWRVNNMPGVTADFTTAQAAHDGANAGDTIHLEPSVNNYGSITTTKRLVWISIGNFLVENPGNQYSSTPGTLTSITVNAGSSFSVFSVSATSGVSINAPSVTFIRSHLTNAAYLLISALDAVIMQCYLAGTMYVLVQSTNAIVTNNILAYVHMTPAANAVITNNVLVHTGGSCEIYNSVFQNNIIRGIQCNPNNSVLSYNIHSGAGLPVGNNNQLNINMTTVFENDGGTADKDYRLKPGSPAMAGGYGGVDIGAFGGNTPYVLALQPAIPAITNLSAPASAVANSIQVTFSAKSNN